MIATLVGRYVERREHRATPCVHDLLAIAAEFGGAAVDELRTVLALYEVMPLQRGRRRLTRWPTAHAAVHQHQEVSHAITHQRLSCSLGVAAMSAPESNPTVTEVLRFEDLRLGSRGTRRAIARWSDGSESEALTWFADEVLVCEGDLIGKTREQLRSLHFRRDRDWLQS